MKATPIRAFLLVTALITAAMIPSSAQRKPDFLDKQAPDPGPNRIEVRFALGDKPLLCHSFGVTAKSAGKVIFSGRFVSGFEIPRLLKNLPATMDMELSLVCGSQHWTFQQVGGRAFLPGWWWVGTDFPPFQEEFQGEKYKNAASVRYFMVRPTKESGYDVVEMKPRP